MPRVPAHWLDPNGGDPGQIPTINGDGTEVGWADPSGGGTGSVESVVAGTHVDVDDTDPANPIVSAYVPLTTVVDGVPDLVWDEDNNLITTKGP